MNNGARAIIDPQGAWVTNLSDLNGDVFFPKRFLVAADGNKKARGGCHVCLPNFGPGGDTGLEQHGFGRTSIWDVESKGDSSATLYLQVNEGEYAGMEARLRYELLERSFLVELSLKGGSEMSVAPGFHPYFSVPRGEEVVSVSGEELELKELPGTLFRSAQEQSLDTGTRTIHISSKELTTWAFWTDRLGSYVCIEPTLGGNMFERGGGISLSKDTPKLFSMQIAW